MTRKNLLKQAVRYSQIIFKYYVDPWSEISFADILEDITENGAACTLEFLEDMEDMEDEENRTAAGLAFCLDVLIKRMDRMGAEK